MRHPEYLDYATKSIAGQATVDPTAGMGLNQMMSPEERKRQEDEARRSYRAQTLCDMARQLEYLRIQMLELDLRTYADRLDTMVVDLVQQWTLERRK